MSADKRLRICEGTCGRMTRTSRMPAHLYPDTVCRANGTHCTSCHAAVLKGQGIVKDRKHRPAPVADPEKAEAAAQARYEAAAKAAEDWAAGRRARLARKERMNA